MLTRREDPACIRADIAAFNHIPAIGDQQNCRIPIITGKAGDGQISHSAAAGRYRQTVATPLARETRAVNKKERRS